MKYWPDKQLTDETEVAKKILRRTLSRRPLWYLQAKNMFYGIAFYRTCKYRLQVYIYIKKCFIASVFGNTESCIFYTIGYWLNLHHQLEGRALVKTVEL